MACCFMARVWELGPKVSAGEKVVLLRLADLAGPDGCVTYRPLSVIAADCGLDSATVEHALVGLMAAGHVSVTRDGCYLLAVAFGGDGCCG